MLPKNTIAKFSANSGSVSANNTLILICKQLVEAWSPRKYSIAGKARCQFSGCVCVVKVHLLPEERMEQSRTNTVLSVY